MPPALQNALLSGRVPATSSQAEAAADITCHKRMARLHQFTVQLDSARATDILPMLRTRGTNNRPPCMTEHARA